MDSTPAVRLLGDRSNLSTNLPLRNRLCSSCSDDLIRIILTMNNFTFNSKHYLQKHGTAMGTKVAPSYANLFLGIFMIWTAGPEKLKTFVDYLNNLHSTINFTCSHSPTNIPFLDVMVSIKDGFIETDLYTKPTDKLQYLLISSSHPQHTKRSIPYSLALRLRRICSNHDNYIMRTTELIDYLVLKRQMGTLLISFFPFIVI